MTPVGLTLQPEAKYLELLDPVLRGDPDYFEVAPETTWVRDANGIFQPNGFHRRFRELGTETGKPFVAHGVGLSFGTVTDDDARLRRWLDRIRADQEAFGYLWYTDHLGWTTLDGRAIALPCPLPMTDTAADAVRDRLAALQAVVPDVGFENSVFYFHLGDPRDEPEFFARILTRPRMHLLLDLHNVYTTALNAGFAATEYLGRLDLSRVIEIHLSGGNASDPAWLPSGRVMRLDSHDHAVPEEVWALFEKAAPRCPNLRGVTLERMEGTVEQADVEPIRGEIRRIRRTLARR